MNNNTIRLSLILLFLTMFCFPQNMQALAPKSIEDNSTTISCAELRAQINESTNPSRIARLYMKLGACYEEQNESAQALTAYLNAFYNSPLALSIQDRIYIAKFAASQHEWDDALAIIENVTKQAPYNREANALYAELLTESGMLVRGKEHVAHSLKEDPTSISYLLIQAKIERIEGKDYAAIRIYNDILNIEENFEARIGLSEIYLKHDELPLAEINATFATPTSTEEVEELKTLQARIDSEKEFVSSDTASSWAHQGDLYVEEGKIQEAVDAYLVALSYSPSDLSESRRIRIAIFLGRHGQRNIAINELFYATKRNPNNHEARYYLALFLAWNRELERAYCENEIILAHEPDEIEPLLLKGNILRWMQCHYEAIALYQKVLAQDPNNFGAHLGLAWVYISLNDYAKVESELQTLQALKTSPEETKELLKGYHQHVVREALGYARKRCYNRAYHLIYSILAQADLDVFITLARIYSWEGKYYNALRIICYVLTLDPCNVEAWNVRGTVLRWKGDYPGSKKAFCKALEIDPCNHDARIGLGYVHMNTNNYGIADDMGRVVTDVTGEVQDALDIYFQSFSLRPYIDDRYYHFRDSDELIIDKNVFTLGHWSTRKTLTTLNQRYVLARDPFVDEELNEWYFEVRHHFGVHLDVMGGLGYAQTDHSDFLTGKAAAFIRTSCGTWSVGIARDAYAETALAIFNDIATFTAYVTYFNTLSGALNLGGNYYYALYNDNNHSNRANVFISQRIHQTWPDVRLRYDFLFIDFARQTFHGYYDPSDLFINQFSLPIFFERSNLFLTLVPFGGYDTYRRRFLFSPDDHIRFRGLFYGGSAVAGAVITHCKRRILEGEVGIEGGSYPLSGGDPYDYFLLSLRIKYTF